jgi:hypothetical protein
MAGSAVPPPGCCLACDCERVRVTGGAIAAAEAGHFGARDSRASAVPRVPERCHVLVGVTRAVKVAGPRVNTKRRRRADVEDRSTDAVLHRRWRGRPVGLVILCGRPAGGGCKPPQAAAVKSRGGERCGNGAPLSASGVGQEGERERSIDDVSKPLRRDRNRVWRTGPG